MLKRNYCQSIYLINTLSAGVPKPDIICIESEQSRLTSASQLIGYQCSHVWHTIA